MRVLTKLTFLLTPIPFQLTCQPQQLTLSLSLSPDLHAHTLQLTIKWTCFNKWLKDLSRWSAKHRSRRVCADIAHVDCIYLATKLRLGDIQQSSDRQTDSLQACRPAGQDVPGAPRLTAIHRSPDRTPMLSCFMPIPAIGCTYVNFLLGSVF